MQSQCPMLCRLQGNTRGCRGPTLPFSGLEEWSVTAGL